MSKFEGTQGAVNQKEKKDVVRIEVDPIEFDGLLKSKITTTLELSETVNALFASTLADYEGCIILPYNAGNGINFNCSLFFRDKGPAMDGRIKCIENILQPERSGSVIDKIERFNKIQNKKVYALTNDCKDALSEFINCTNRDGKVNWNNIVFEQCENRTIYVKVDCIDLYKILKKIYGVPGQKSDYTIIPLKPLAPNNFMVNVLQLDVKSMEILAHSVGLVPNGSQLPIVRARV